MNEKKIILQIENWFVVNELINSMIFNTVILSQLIPWEW